MFGRPLAAVRLRVYVPSFVYDENRILINSNLQICAIGADPGHKPSPSDNTVPEADRSLQLPQVRLELVKPVFKFGV